jgi:two-component system, sensor histidine kinase and response regulator
MKETFSVLLSGNDQIFLPYLENLLQNKGIKASLAYSPKDALALLNENIYHLIISDYNFLLPEEGIFLKWILEQGMALIILEEEGTESEHGFSNNFEGDYLICKKTYSERYLLNNIFYVLNKHQNKVEQTNTSANKHLEIIYHDLLSPLAGLEKATDVLAKNASGIDAKELSLVLQDIHTAVADLYNYADTGLNLHRNNIMLDGYIPVKINLAKKVAMVTKVLKFPIKEKNLNIISLVSKKNHVWFNQPLLIVCLNNVLSNAIKFSYPGADIIISAHTIDNYIKLQVKDHGIGIKESDLKGIFSGRHPKEGTAGERGYGIGLKTIKEYLEKAQGRIEIESAEGKGTTVSLFIPTTLRP